MVDLDLVLSPLQEQGVEFLMGALPLSGNPHRLLADAPGVGKTVEISAAVKRIGAASGLVICPDADVIKHSWKWHLVNWGGIAEDDIYIVANSSDPIPNKPFIIVGYALVRFDNVFRELFWRRYDFIAVDEAKRLKALDSVTSKRILANGNQSLISRGYYKWLADGTIMPNRAIELFPILKTLAPECIDPYLTLDAFGNQYCGGGDFRGSSNIVELRERLKPFMLRRSLEDTGLDIETTEENLYVDIGDLPDGVAETNSPMATLRKAIGVAKIPYVCEYLQYRIQNDPDAKLLVFTYHREVSEQVVARIDGWVGESGACFDTVPSCRLIYGGMTAREKTSALAAFLTKPNVKILVAQLNSAGEGVDGLQNVCNNVIFAEPDWSGGGYDQCIGRLKRYGQTKPVDVSVIIAENTLDENIVHSRKRKLKNIGTLMQSSEPVVIEIPAEQHTNEEIDIMAELGLLERLVAAAERQAEALERIAACNENPLMVVGGAAEEPKSAAKKPAAKKVAGSKTAIESSATDASVSGETNATDSGANGASDTPAGDAGPNFVAGSGDATATPVAEPPTQDEIRLAAKDALLAMGNTPDARVKIKAVMQKFNVEALADLPTEHYASALAEYKAMTAATSADAVI